MLLHRRIVCVSNIWFSAYSHLWLHSIDDIDENLQHTRVIVNKNDMKWNQTVLLSLTYQYRLINVIQNFWLYYTLYESVFITEVSRFSSTTFKVYDYEAI